jgi:hypothetical protein
MIILIILGLFQALFLPGLICSYYVKKISVSDRLILATTLSLVVNYLIVWLLYVLNIYSQVSVLALIAVEVMLLVKLRTHLFKDLHQVYQFAHQFIERSIKTKAISFYALFFILFCVYYFYLLKTSGFLTVFTHWDAVVSWNRWAVELYEGTFQGSRGYPLAVPILFSLIYTISDQTNVQTLVKYICVYWPFLGGLALFCAGQHAPKLKNIFAFSSVFYLYLLSKGSYTIDFIFSGLIDPIMAAFGALFVYYAVFVNAQKTLQQPEYKKIVALALLSVCGSALVKLTGVILWFEFVCVICFVLFYSKQLQQHKRYFLLAFVATCALAIHWYALTTVYWKDWQQLAQYDTLQDPRVWLRPYLHLTLFGSTFGWLFVVLAAIGACSSRNALALLCLLVAPLFIFCGIAVGYDLRATFIVFAPIALLAALGVSSIYQNCVRAYDWLSTTVSASPVLATYAPFALALITSALVLGGLTQVLSDDKILSSNTEKRAAANDFANGGNKRLLQIFESEPNAQIISCWQTPFGLPGAKGRFIPSGNCTVTLPEGWLSDPRIKYWLYRDEGNPSQLLTPEVVARVLAKYAGQIQAESLGSGFVLYSK